MYKIKQNLETIFKEITLQIKNSWGGEGLVQRPIVIDESLYFTKMFFKAYTVTQYLLISTYAALYYYYCGMLPLVSDYLLPNGCK